MPDKKEHKDNPILGMSAAIAAFFMFAVMQTFAKLLTESHHVIEIAFYRNLIGTLPFLFIIFAMNRKKILVINSKPKTIIARSILGTVSLIVTFAAFAMMPMADATAFLFTASLFIPILSILFLSEKVGIYRWMAIIIGFSGVLVMLSPSGNVNMLGAFTAISAAMMHAVLQVVLRSLGKHESPETVTFYFFVIGIIVTALMMPFVYTPVTINNVPFIIGVGLSGLAAQFLLSIAYKNAEATIVTVFNYSGIIWATIFGWMIWNDWPAMTIWTGASIVIASNIFMIWRESKKGTVTGDRVRAKF